MILGALAADLLLNFGEGNNMEHHAAAPGHQFTGQLLHLLQRLTGGVGGREEVHQLQLHAALGHHEGGDRAVDSAGEKAHSLAAHADGQTTRAALSGGVDIGCGFADFHMDGQLRIVHIDREMGIFLMQHTAHILGDLDAGHGELLVGTLGLDLEGARAAELFAQIALGALQNGVLILFAGRGAADSHDAENLAAGIVCLVQIALALGLDIDGALLGVNVESAAVLQTAADICHQLILKSAAVETLEDDLAEFKKNDLVHMI